LYRSPSGAGTTRTPPSIQESLAWIKENRDRWRPWWGVSGLLYASRKLTSPPDVVRGKDLAALVAEIDSHERRYDR
jgi:hypothetical protein